MDGHTGGGENENPMIADAAPVKLEEAIRQAAQQYFRLVIMAGPPGSGKTATLQALATKLGCEVLNVNLELSKRMLELTRIQRSRQVERLMKEVIAAATGEIVLLDNLEILFDTSLEVEPLRLLQLSSRNRTIVASWSGSYRDATLTYAAPGHPEFAQMKQFEAIVINVGKYATD
jgi:Cdc6-like AAA superfamily ATPase